MFASFPVMAAWANAVVFASAGLVNLTALRGVREGYARWDIPGAFYRTLGIVEIIAAALLATPDLRAWGIAIAAPIMFGAIVMLLNHRQYLYAVPAVLVMAALVPGTLATPQPRSYLHYEPAQLSPASPSMAIAGGFADKIMIANVRGNSTPQSIGE
jgi:hypothetical protein